MTMQVHGGTSRFSWYDDPIPSNMTSLNNMAVRRAGVPVPEPVPRRAAELPELLVDEAVPDAGRDEHARRQARDQVRRRVPQGPAHESVGPEPPRHIYVQPPAVDARFSKPHSRRMRGTIRRDGISACCSRSCSSTRSSSTTTTWLTSRRSQTAAWFGDNWRVSNTLTINLGVRYDVDPEGLDPQWVRDIPIIDRQRARQRQLRLPARRARLQQRRAARRVRLQRRRQQRPRDPRRHRPLLQLPGVERDLPAAVLQQRDRRGVPADRHQLPLRPARWRHARTVSVRRGARRRRRKPRSSRPTTAIRTAGRARSASRSSWDR